jgi:hypothetical protein
MNAVKIYCWIFYWADNIESDEFTDADGTRCQKVVELT